jgi:DNA-binding transcriptional MerR regulator
VASDETRYGIDELAELGGVSRRTVRYYLQEGLLPAPLGVGRGSHYAREHLDRLLRVKSMQEAGLTLEAIQREVTGARPAARQAEPAPARSIWRRVTLAPGLELHVRGDLPGPPATALQPLLDWCRLHSDTTGDADHAKD